MNAQGIDTAGEIDGRYDLSRRVAPGAIAVALSVVLGAWILFLHPPAARKAPELAGAPGQNARIFGGLVALTPHRSPPALASASPYGELIIARFEPEPKFAVVERDSNPEVPLLPRAETPSNDVAPLPPQRPAEFAEAPRPPEIEPALPPARTTRVARLDAKPPAHDERNLLERLFGLQHSSPGEPATARDATIPAGRGSSFLDSLRGGGPPRPAGPAARYGNSVAVYDISARTVYMPDGTQLEAHSGLAAQLDDPRSVRVRMRGPTPPATYELTPREALFHGVQALRMTPVEGNVFGRVGLLAHTYMLGPNGDSNGCLSFRDYDAFLRAYQNGQIRKLVVVASL